MMMKTWPSGGMPSVPPLAAAVEGAVPRSMAVAKASATESRLMRNVRWSTVTYRSVLRWRYAPGEAGGEPTRE